MRGGAGLAPAFGDAEGDEAVELVPIVSLTVSDSPRLDGENEEHIRRLVETDDSLPPILVHRPTMLVVDGMHRLRAAQFRGERTIAARFVDCARNEIFVAAVKANIAHGLPLSLADRKAAAGRILTSHPHWSDRMIAAATGLAHKTVGRIRHDLSGDLPGANVRIGQDGHVRPLMNYGREVAEEIISRHPETPLRTVAKTAGISVSTAHDVRRKMALGASTVNPPERSGEGAAEEPVVDLVQRPRVVAADTARLMSVLHRLQADPSLRFTDSGRALLRLLGSHSLTDEDWGRLVDSVPAHWTSAVASMAREFGTAWQGFAARLDEVTQRSARSLP